MRALPSFRLASALLVLACGTAVAQDPVRLPGMSVKAAPPPPGPKLFAGIVRDTDATPLEGVEIIIPELRRRVLSNPDGTFRFTDMPTGEFQMRARRIGYAPQVRDFKVTKEGGSGAFELVPWPYRMPSVVTRVARGGISGRVADTGFVPVANAVVSVTTKALRVETDSNGAFFLPAPPGSWMVIIRKPGYADRIASVTVPDDSGRHISAMLLPARAIPIKEVHNIDDLEKRQTWHNQITQPFYTHEDIQNMGITWIYDLVRAAGLEQFSMDCSVVIDGGPSTRMLSSLTVDEVESVEVYHSERFKSDPAAGANEARLRAAALGRPSGSGSRKPPIPPRPTTATEAIMQRVPITNTNVATFENQGIAKRCPGAVYVWLR